MQKDTTLVDIAKAGLSAAEDVAQAALAAGAWLAKRSQDTLDVEIVELSGSLRTIVGGGAFTIHVRGVTMGKAFDFYAAWSPREVLAFVVALCEKLWADFKTDMLRKEITAV